MRVALLVLCFAMPMIGASIPLRSPHDSLLSRTSGAVQPVVMLRSQLIGRTNYVWWVTVQTNRPVVTVNFTNAPVPRPGPLAITWLATGTLLTSTNLTTWSPTVMSISASVRITNSSPLMFFRVPANVGASSNSVSLGWSASPSPVSGYVLYYGSSRGAYQHSIMVEEVQTRIDGLTPGQTYYFAVTAVDGLGLESDKSNEVSYAVPIPEITAQPTIR